MRCAFVVAFLGALSGITRADDALLSLRVSHDVEGHGKTTLSLVVTPAPGLRLLEEGPLTLDLEGVAIGGTRSLRRQDAIDPRAETPRFEVALHGGKVEPSEIHAHVLAWVCRGKRCRPYDLTQTVPLAGARHAP